MTSHPKQDEPAGRRPAEVDENWFTRIQRATHAREQGRKAREGKPPVNPLSGTPLSPNHDSAQSGAKPSVQGTARTAGT